MSFRAKLIYIFVGVQAVAVSGLLLALLGHTTEIARRAEIVRIATELEILEIAVREPLLLYDYAAIASTLRAVAGTAGVRWRLSPTKKRRYLPDLPRRSLPKQVS